MESVGRLAHRLMAEFEDRLSLDQITWELLAVLAECGHRVGQPVPADAAREVRRRLQLATLPRLPQQRTGTP
jgi:hypothetical protein